MMQDLRKHRRWLLIVLIVATVAGLSLFGVDVAFNQNNQNQVDAAIGSVGSVELKQSDLLRNLEMMAQPGMMGGERKTFAQLDQEGKVDEILESMIDSALIELESKSRNIEVEREYLVERLKDMRMFQDETGNFSPAAWNQWVEAGQGKTDWNKVYAAVQDEVSRWVYLRGVLGAAARVSARELDRKLNDNYTKLTVRYAAIEPAVDATDEQLRAFYDAAPDDYKLPDDIVADYVAISLLPEPSAELLDVVKRAREGADFAQLVQEFSDTNKETGGDKGWQAPMDPEPQHRAPMFALKVGEVSDPVAVLGGFTIYRVDEERTDAAGKREVKVREIFKRARLDDAERAARVARANALKDAAAAASDLAAAASAEGLTVVRSPRFNTESNAIEGIAATDARAIANTFKTTGETQEPFKVSEGRSAVYVLHEVERQVGAVPPFEEVIEKVRTAYDKAEKSKQAYKDRVAEYVTKIKAQATSLQQAAELFPELKLTVAEAQPFTAKDFMVQGINVQSAQVATELRDKEPGAMVGPFESFFGDKKSYMVELAARTPPTDEDRAKFDEERERMRKSELMQLENEFLDDYRKDLRERKLTSVGVTIDRAAIDAITGVDREAAAPADPAPAPAADAPAPAPAPAAN